MNILVTLSAVMCVLATLPPRWSRVAWDDRMRVIQVGVAAVYALLAIATR